MFVMSSLLWLQNEDYIVIKGKETVPPAKEDVKKSPSKNENTDLEEITQIQECERYQIKEVYRCKTCLKYVAESQKEQHNPSHDLEKVKVGERLKCTTCGRLFFGEFTHYCPKCKGKLKVDTIEIEEVVKDNETFFVNKKNGKRICSDKESVEGEKEPKDNLKEARK